MLGLYKMLKNPFVAICFGFRKNVWLVYKHKYLKQDASSGIKGKRSGDATLPF